MVSTGERAGGNDCGRPGRLSELSQVRKNLPLPRGGEADSPVGSLFWDGESRQGQAFGKGEKGSAGWAGPLPAPLEKCRAVGGQA